MPALSPQKIVFRKFGVDKNEEDVKYNAPPNVAKFLEMVLFKKLGFAGIDE